MSLSKIDKLARVAVIEGNIIAAKLARLLQPSRERHGDTIACTDGKIIYVSSQFWELPLNQQYFILNHEFLHIILKHVERSKGKNGRLYNIAADIIINELIAKRGRTVPDGLCTYEAFNVPRELDTTDKIYNWLLSNNNQDDVFSGDLFVETEGDAGLEEVVKNIKELVSQEIDSKYSIQARKECIISVLQNFVNKVDWFNDLMCELGRLAIRTNIKTYNRPSRIKIPGCILRGGYIEQSVPKANIIIDVSGSMGDEPIKIAQKIVRMRDYLKVFKPTYYWLNETWGKIDDITKIPLGGGTALSNIKYIKGADINVLITDCEDEAGIDELNRSSERFYVVTNNANTKIINSHNHRVFITTNF